MRNHEVMGNPAVTDLLQALPDGKLEFLPHFLAEEVADHYFNRLLDELSWQEEKLRIAGRPIPVPRRVCWYGDPGAVYRYSGVDHEPLPWTPALTELLSRIEGRTGGGFNSVLGNLYRDGQDSMGWHADKERELGPEPCIASLSLGAPRRFDLRHNRSGNILSLTLNPGSLLLMGGPLQQHWRHRVPKQPALTEPRINLSFRTILPDRKSRRP